MNQVNDTISSHTETGAAEPDEIITERNLQTVQDTRYDPAIGGAIGLVGGAVVGGLAGGPLGAVVGAVAGAIGGDAAVESVELLGRNGSSRTSDRQADADRFSNSGADTPSFDAETGVTTHDTTAGDIGATDHVIMGSNENEVFDESMADPPLYRKDNN